MNSVNSSPQPGNICLLVHGLNDISPFVLYVFTDAVLDVFIHSWQFFYRDNHVQYLCWYMPLMESMSSSMDVGWRYFE